MQRTQYKLKTKLRTLSVSFHTKKHMLQVDTYIHTHTHVYTNLLIFTFDFSALCVRPKKPITLEIHLKSCGETGFVFKQL